MPTHDYIISNGTGAAVRADINSALSAIVSLNSSASEPATMYAYQLWADTTNGLLKIRNSANSAWITLRQLDGDFSIVAVEDGLQATPSLTFTNDLNTGIFRPGNDSLAIVSGGTRSITITSTQAVGIQTANPNAPLHVAGVARIGADDATDATVEIGAGATGNRNAFIDLVGDTTYTDYGVRFIRNNTGANATSEIKHRGTGNFNITTQEASAIEFSTTNTPRVTITSGGLVGLGTSNPTTKLHVVVSVEDPTTGAPGSTSFVQVRGDTTTVGYGPSIALSNVSGAKETFWRISAVTASANNGDLVFNGYNGGATYPERLRITAGGLVGIGTTTPTNTDKLEIQTSSTSAPGLWVQTGGTTSAYPIADFRTGSNLSALLIRGDGASVFTGKVLVGTSGSFNGGLFCIGSGQGTNPPSGEHIKIAPSANRIEFLDSSSNASDTGSVSLFNTVYGNRSANIKLFHPAGNVGAIAFETHDGVSLKERMKITDQGNVNINTIGANLRLLSSGEMSSWGQGIRIGHDDTYYAGIFCNGDGNFDRQYLDFWTSRATSAGLIARLTDRFYCNVTTITAFSSERRYKQNIDIEHLDADKCWDVVKNLPVRTYEYKDNPGNMSYGPIVDEIEPIDPSLIIDTGRTDDEGAVRTYDNGRLQAMHQVALQAALKRIETLETRLSTLEAA